MNGIEDVLIECANENGLNITEENNPMYDEFIHRQLITHEDYDLNKYTGTKNFPKYPFVSLLSDKVYYFSILILQTKVRGSEFSDETEHVDSKEKLKYLQLFSSEEALWPDSTLYNIDNRRKLNKKKSGMMSSREILNELFQDEQVVKIRGKGLTYENSIRGRRREMRKLTPNLEYPV